MNCFGLLLVSSAGYVLSVSKRVSLKVVTTGLFRGTKSWKIRIFNAIIVKQNEGVRPKRFMFSEDFRMFIPCSAIYFLEIGPCLHWNEPPNGFLEAEEQWKFRFSGYFFNAKTEECDWKYWFVSDRFGISIPCSAPYFLEVGARFSLKVATKFLKLYSLKKKRGSTTKAIFVFQRFLERCITNFLEVTTVGSCQWPPMFFKDKRPQK